MGGKALNVPTRPISKEEHTTLSSELCSRRSAVRNSFSSTTSIPAIYDKLVFNDVDLVCGYWYESEEGLRGAFCREFGSTEVIFNGNCITFDYRLDIETRALLSPEQPGVQVDIRWYRDDSEYEFALRYFSYGDLGNIIGTLFRHYGFKLKDTGLYYQYMNNSEMLGEVMVTQSFEVALMHIDLDRGKFADGFSDGADVFYFVAASDYFKPSLFLFENLDSKNRLRNKKRVMYSNFVEWCTKTYPAELLVKEHATEVELDDFLERAFEISNSFQERFIEIGHDFLLKKYIKQCIGGEVVKSLTGFTGEKLGRFIRHISSRYGYRGLLERDAIFHPERIHQFIYLEKLTFEEDLSKCGEELLSSEFIRDDEEDLLDF